MTLEHATWLALEQQRLSALWRSHGPTHVLEELRQLPEATVIELMMLNVGTHAAHG